MALKQREPPLRRYLPRWPDPERIDPDGVRWTYWDDVDTLMVDLFGESRPAVSVPLDLGGDRDYLFLRIDPSTDDVVGVQIEDFLRYAVHRRPSLRGALVLAGRNGPTQPDSPPIPATNPATSRDRRALVATLLAELRNLVR